MAAIDVGSGAINRSAYRGDSYTRIGLFNPANATGRLQYVELWFETNATGVKVATFSKSGSVFTARDVVTIGNVTAGSKQTFSVDLAVSVGDYIGVYYQTGTISADTSGGTGIYNLYGDHTDDAETYALGAGDAISLYATGSSGDIEDGIASIAVGASVAPSGAALMRGVSALTAAASLALVGGTTANGAAAISSSTAITAQDVRMRYGALVAEIAAALALVGEKNLIEALAAIGIAASIAPNGNMVLKGEASLGILASLALLGTDIDMGFLTITAAASATALSTRLRSALAPISASASIAGITWNVVGGAVVVTVRPTIVTAGTGYLAQIFGYTGTLSPGDVLVIDCDQKIVELNGVNAVRYMTGAFPLLFSGTNEIRWEDDDAARTVAVAERHEPRWL